MDIPYTSDELFHFAGYGSPTDDEKNYQTPLKILHDGCISHPPHNNDWGSVTVNTNWDGLLRYGDDKKNGLIIPTVTCFADIPSGGLGIHIEKYGKFGISFSRDYLIRYGARPVMYVPMRNDDWQSIHGTTLLNDLEAIYKSFHELVTSEVDDVGQRSRPLEKRLESRDAAIVAMDNAFTKDFLAFIKPFNAHLPVNHEENYYMEREWRKLANLKFEPENVCQVSVVKGYKSRLIAELPAYEDKTKEI